MWILEFPDVNISGKRPKLNWEKKVQHLLLFNKTPKQYTLGRATKNNFPVIGYDSDTKTQFKKLSYTQLYISVSEDHKLIIDKVGEYHSNFLINEVNLKEFPCEETQVELSKYEHEHIKRKQQQSLEVEEAKRAKAEGREPSEIPLDQIIVDKMRTVSRFTFDPSSSSNKSIEVKFHDYTIVSFIWEKLNVGGKLSEADKHSLTYLSGNIETRPEKISSLSHYVVDPENDKMEQLKVLLDANPSIKIIYYRETPGLFGNFQKLEDDYRINKRDPSTVELYVLRNCYIQPSASSNVLLHQIDEHQLESLPRSAIFWNVNGDNTIDFSRYNGYILQPSSRLNAIFDPSDEPRHVLYETGITAEVNSPAPNPAPTPAPSTQMPPPSFGIADTKGSSFGITETKPSTRTPRRRKRKSLFADLDDVGSLENAFIPTQSSQMSQLSHPLSQMHNKKYGGLLSSPEKHDNISSQLNTNPLKSLQNIETQGVSDIGVRTLILKDAEKRSVSPVSSQVQPEAEDVSMADADSNTVIPKQEMPLQVKPAVKQEPLYMAIDLDQLERSMQQDEEQLIGPQKAKLKREEKQVTNLKQAFQKAKSIRMKTEQESKYIEEETKPDIKISTFKVNVSASFVPSVYHGSDTMFSNPDWKNRVNYSTFKNTNKGDFNLVMDSTIQGIKMKKASEYKSDRDVNADEMQELIEQEDGIAELDQEFDARSRKRGQSQTPARRATQRRKTASRSSLFVGDSSDDDNEPIYGSTQRTRETHVPPTRYNNANADDSSDDDMPVFKSRKRR
ncbi:unnamed protein product [Ambrosiozyma monospora]|uniref:Unnamed protein product n=1 Tax=Ambrosiozyma monospora TaxID=43982 RepID=A0A9W6YZI2_AMBMO|nr:unnamed protein product [Ambrosiozyma monospora]